MANKLDPRVDSDRSKEYGNTNTYGSNTGNTYGSNTGPDYSGSNTTAGPHNSNMANKLDPRVDSDRSKEYGNTNTYGSGSGPNYSGNTTTAGPHNSNVANKLDPRVDSDRSKEYGNTSNTYGSNTGNTHSSNTGNTYGSNTGPNYSSSSTTAGPHNSNVANKLDPRVDSDRSKEYGNTSNTYGSSTGNTYGSNTGNTYGTNTGSNYSNTAGPQNSNVANKLDPRVDSDRSKEYGNTNTYGSTSGPNYSGSSNTGPHNSNLANKLDPRVDSDNDNRNNPTSRAGGYGTQDNNYNSSNVGDTTTSRPNRRSVAFEDEPRHRGTSPDFTPPHGPSTMGTQDLSSVSSVNQSTGDGLHVPPRGTAVRGNSGYAPESISGNVERVPTTSHRRGEGYDEYSSADERKGGTFSKLFKRKPVSGAETGTTGTTTTGEERKKFF